jgi:cellulose biosynthesis protein BcsQ
MANGDNRTAAGHVESDDQLAKDVARLYAWANVKGVPYRDFSRQRPAHHTQPLVPGTLVPGEDQSAEIVSVAGQTTPVAVPVVNDIPPASYAGTADLGHASTLPQPAASSPQLPVETPAVAPLLGARPRPRPRFAEQILPVADGNRPALALFSFAGGVGKTTISANLARILCVQGEDVLLVDASGSGLLPFYFGANDLRPGLRTFVAPGLKCSRLRVIGAEEVSAAWLEKDVSPAMAVSQRTIFDLGPASFSLMPQIFARCSEILVPLVPDFNSILSISRIEHLLDKIRAAGTQVPSPYYVFNQFDSEFDMDLEARELAGRQCRERLLPLAVRHGAEVAEAIASRMTVADYAPISEVTSDFLELALWLEKVAPALQIKSVARWTEQ